MKFLLTGKNLGAIAAIVALVGLFFLLGRLLDIDEYLNPHRVQDLLEAAGPLAPLGLILIMAVAVVVSPIPSLPLDLAAGATFGPFLGMTYAVIGAEIGAIISFLIGRALGRDLLTKLFRTNVVFCERCSDRHLMLLLVVARLIPVFSFDVISYGAGLTRISLRMFAIATLVGMIPPTFALTYLGNSLIAVQWPMIVAGLAMVAIFLLTPKLATRYPSAWWARLFLLAEPAPAPAAPQQLTVQETQEGSTEGFPMTCSGCGASLNQ